MLKTIFLFVALCWMGSSLAAQNSPVGVWKTIDDETGEAKSHIEIYQKNGGFYGKVIKLLQKPADTRCEKCSGALKNQLIVGMEVLTGLTPYKDYWSNGNILDPNNGKTYSCSIWLENKNQLKVRGYLGVSLLGRTQTWTRIK